MPNKASTTAVRRTPRFLRALALIGLLPGLDLAAHRAGAQVVTDGSLGPAGAVPQVGGDYAVTPALGRKVGGNLFHSFGQFDLSAGESATFSGPGDVSRVLARVTGGSPSLVNGTIRCTIPDADFFLMNPSGVVFGPSAALDVQGSFAVTTADVIRLADGRTFSATPGSADTLLSTAPPAAFGFLGPTPVGAGVSGATLAVPAGRSLSVAAGSVQIVGGTLRAPGGRVNVAAVASAGDLALDVTDLDAVVDASPFDSLAAVDIGTGSLIDGDGVPGTPDAAGGGVAVRGGPVTIGGGSNINSFTSGDEPGRLVDVRSSTGFLIEGGSFFQVGTFAAGRGGDVRIFAAEDVRIESGSGVLTGTGGTGPSGDVSISAAAVTLDGKGATGSTRISSFVFLNTATGPGGRIEIDTPQLTLRDGAALFANTLGPGDAGSVDIDAGAVTLDAAGSLLISGINVDTILSDGGGRGGTLRLRAGTLDVLRGAAISADTAGSGDAGSIDVAADRVVLDGMGAPFTAIRSDTIGAAAGAGRGGTVRIEARDLQVLDGAEIGSNADGAGDAGSLDIRAERLVVDRRQSEFFTRISSTAQAIGADVAGDAGRLRVEAGDLRLLNGAAIGSDTFSRGDAGLVEVTARDVLIEGVRAGGIVGSSISSTAFAGETSGAAGRVVVRAENLSVVRGGSIAVINTGPLDAGGVDIAAGNILIDAAGSDFVTGINTRNLLGATGRGGSVRVLAGEIRMLDGADLSATTVAPGDAGDITVRAGRLIIDGRGRSTGISSEASDSLDGGPIGAGGDVRIEADEILMVNGGGVAAATTGPGTGGRVDAVARRIVIDGQGADFFTGFAASTLGSGPSLPDAVRVRADELIIIRGGGIDASAFASGAGGGVFVQASSLILDGLGERTGITAQTNAADGGPGGRIEIVAGELKVFGSAIISTTTRGRGEGGDLLISATNITLDRQTAGVASGIAAQTEGILPTAGNGGTATVRANTLRVVNGARVSGASFGTGRAGDVIVEGENVVLDKGTATIDTGILSETRGLTTDGDDADTLSDDLDGDGTVEPGVEDLDDSNGLAADVIPAGPAGTVTVRAGRLRVVGGAEVSSGTLNRGAGGDVLVQARDVSLTTGGSINSSSTGPMATGPAGSVSVTASNDVRLSEGALVSVRADRADAGSIRITSLDGSIVLTDNRHGVVSPADAVQRSIRDPAFELPNTRVTAEAPGGSAGQIKLTAPRRVQLTNSLVTAQARQLSEGTAGTNSAISIDPEFVLLDNSVINGLIVNPSGGGGGADVRDVPVFIDPAAQFVRSSDSQILSNAASVPVEVDIAGSLARLPGGLADAAAQLQDVCGVRITGDDDAPVSSFVVTGRGGRPVEPGAWLPSLELAPQHEEE